jgi:hypothetical protein
MRSIRWLGGFCGLYAGLVWAQPPLGEVESKAQAEVQAQRADGLIAVQPWVQLLGAGRLGVGWLTSQAADGVAEWTQDGAEADVPRWRQAWFSEDGLKQANGTSQRAVIEGYDPTRPIRFRAVSRSVTAFKPYTVTFGEPVTSQERRLPALERPDGAVSFIVFNDVHNRYQNYPLLLSKAGAAPDFAVFNGDVLQDPQSEKELTEHLLLPMAWFSSRSLPCFFLRGNHETRGAFARPMKAYLTLPEGRYYTAMTFGAARVLFLDSGEDKPDDSKEYCGLVDFGPYVEAELAWLKREIAGEAFRQATWRIVVMHIPPDWREEDAKLWHGERRVRERFAPLFDEGKVHVVISGHNHTSEMIEPCPDVRRGFQWPVFVGGAPALTNATVIRVDAAPQTLKVACVRSDGAVAAEKSWAK